MLQLHKLKREEGGGYRCLASVPSVPGLNRSQLVNVAVFGEALELVSVFKLSGGQKSPAALGHSGVGRGWRAGRECCLNPPFPHTGPPWMALREKKMWVKENSVLNLSCEASGHPRPSIVWSVHGTVSGARQPPRRWDIPLQVLLPPPDTLPPLSRASFLVGK